MVVSTEEMNRLIAEKIDLETRMRMVYVPIFTELIAIDLIEKSFGYLAGLKVSETKKQNRSVRELISHTRKTYKDTMKQELWDKVTEQSADFQHAIVTDLFVYQQTYVREALNLNKTPYDLEVAVATMLVVKDICGEIIRYDKDYNKIANDMLNDGVTDPRKKVTLSENKDWLSQKLIGEIDKCLTSLGFPTDIYNSNIELARKIIRKKMDLITL